MISRPLFIASRYISYRLKAKTRHGIHSPFVFDFVSNVLNDKSEHPEYQQVEKLRGLLLRNPNLVEVIDFGAGKGRAKYSTSLRRVKDIAARSGIPVKQGRLLHRMVKYYKPKVILEMGTSVGISSMYQISAAPDSTFLAMEGCASTAEFAEKNLKALGATATEFIVGNFDVVLPDLMKRTGVIDFAFIDGNHTKKGTLSYFNRLEKHAANDSVFVFHDIHWSPEMEEAWETIRKHESVRVSIDLFWMGIVFFRRELGRQHFIIRF